VGVVDDRIAPLGRQRGGIPKGFLGFDSETIGSPDSIQPSALSLQSLMAEG
jgi:hypothetical protein